MYDKLMQLLDWETAVEEGEILDKSKATSNKHGYNEMIDCRVLDSATGEEVMPSHLGKGHGPLGYEYCYSPLANRLDLLRKGLDFTNWKPLTTPQKLTFPYTGRYVVEQHMPEEILNRHFNPVYERSMFDDGTLSGLAAVNYWWWNYGCKSFGVPIKPIDLNRVQVPLVDDPKETLVYLTIADYFQRAPGLIWAYRELIKRCPTYDRWSLFQVAHMLPWGYSWGSSGHDQNDGWCNLNTTLKPEYKGRVAEFFTLFAHGLNYQLGNSQGIFDIVPTFAESLKNTLEKKSLNDGFFPSSKGNPVPRYDWTFDEFAEFARYHIDHQEVRQEAPAVCC